MCPLPGKIKGPGRLGLFYFGGLLGQKRRSSYGVLRMAAVGHTVSGTRHLSAEQRAYIAAQYLK